MIKASAIAILVTALTASACAEADDTISAEPTVTETTRIIEIEPPKTYEVKLSCPKAISPAGLIVCKATPGAIILKDGKKAAIADKEGRVWLGVPLGAKKAVSVQAEHEGKNMHFTSKALTIDLLTRNDPSRHIDGLDCDKVDARTPEQKDHAGRSWVKKQKGWKRFEPTLISGDLEFIAPAAGPESSPFGPKRTYSGVSKATGETCNKTRIHQGLDIATPVGTDLIAPEAGTIILAEPDLYYEGGTIFLDHGMGLLSVFMHLSAVDVQAGQIVEKGERLGATGNTGRTTGPHLHWAVKWRNTQDDSRKGDFYIDPKLLLNGG